MAMKQARKRYPRVRERLLLDSDVFDNRDVPIDRQVCEGVQPSAGLGYSAGRQQLGQTNPSHSAEGALDGEP
jgi:hypothetical protein